MLLHRVYLPTWCILCQPQNCLSLSLLSLRARRRTKPLNHHHHDSGTTTKKEPSGLLAKETLALLNAPTRSNPRRPRMLFVIIIINNNNKKNTAPSSNTVHPDIHMPNVRPSHTAHTTSPPLRPSSLRQQPRWPGPLNRPETRSLPVDPTCLYWIP